MAKSKTPKKQILQSPKGMHDILPADQAVWEKMRKTARVVAEFYNFSRIETPILEAADLFERSIGEATDVVEKQMFTLTTKGKDRLVLRPEATAPIARAYIQHGLHALSQPMKLWCEGPFFRYEQPQSGRFRQFHQLDFEIISGENDPIYDAQVIVAGFRFLEDMKIKDQTIAVNTIGCQTCRPAYKKQLEEYYQDKKKMLCKDCERRLATSPLRLLDCKEEGCKELKKDAPIIVDCFCNTCHTHFKTVLEYLEELKLPYVLDHFLVRGFDYYSKTVFEYKTAGIDFSLGGGGRYDYLIELLGGRPSPAVGVAIGLERVVEVLKLRGIAAQAKPKVKIFMIYIGPLAKRRSLTIIENLREAGVDVMESFGRESFKAQLRTADKFAAPLALIFGQKEAFEDTMIVRDLRTGEQETVPLKKVVDNIKHRLANAR